MIGEMHQQCEVCGKRATCFVRDTIRYQDYCTGGIEIRPGTTHYFCQTHKRDSQSTKIDATVMKGFII